MYHFILRHYENEYRSAIIFNDFVHKRMHPWQGHYSVMLGNQTMA